MFFVMKKLFTLLALAAGCCLSLHAQTWYDVAGTETALADLETGTYALGVTSDKTNATLTGYDNVRLAYRSGTSVPVVLNTDTDHQYMGKTISDAAYLWVVTKTTETDGTVKLSLKNLQSGTYISSTNGTTTYFTLNSSEMYYTALASTNTNYAGTTVLYSSDYSYYVVNNGVSATGENSKLGCWTYTAALETQKDDVAHFRFYKAEEATNKISCTVNFQVDGKTVHTVTADIPANADISTLPTALTPLHSAYYTIGACSNENTTVSADNTTFNYPVTKGTAPFWAYTEADKKWYTIYLRSNEGNHVIRTGDDASQISTGSGNSHTTPFTTASVTTKAIFDNGLWAFVESGLGVKLLSKGSGKYVTVNSETYSGNKIAVKLTGEGTTFYTAASGSSFTLTYNGTGSLGDHMSGKLCVWNGNNNFSTSKSDPGSMFVIEGAHEEGSDIMSIGQNAVVTELGITQKTAAFTSTTKDSEATDDYLCRVVPTEGQETLAAALEAVNATTTPEELDTAYTEQSAKVNALTIDFTVTPDPTAYYVIRNANYPADDMAFLSTLSMKTGTDGTLGTTYDSSSNRNVSRVSEATDLVPRLWQFKANGSGWNIYNANVGNPLRNYTASGDLDMPTNKNAGGVYTLRTAPASTFTSGTSGKTNDGMTMVQLIADSKAVTANSDGTTTATTSLDASDAAGNYWQVIKVNSVPVTVTSAAGWASVCLPFAVTLPSDTKAKAYIGKAAADGNLTLTEVTAIPAKTGFLIALSGGGTVDLAISTDVADLTESNVLLGATAKRDGFAGGANYFLALDPVYKRAVFMQSDDSFTVVPANKAYLPATSVQTTGSESAGKLSFVFDGGSTTGISAAQSESQREVKYYDISGRRVLYPANGIFVTDKGEKVFVR